MKFTDAKYFNPIVIYHYVLYRVLVVTEQVLVLFGVLAIHDFEVWTTDILAHTSYPSLALSNSLHSMMALKIHNVEINTRYAVVASNTASVANIKSVNVVTKQINEVNDPNQHSSIRLSF